MSIVCPTGHLEFIKPSSVSALSLRSMQCSLAVIRSKWLLQTPFEFHRTSGDPDTIRADTEESSQEQCVGLAVDPRVGRVPRPCWRGAGLLFSEEVERVLDHPLRTRNADPDVQTLSLFSKEQPL